MKLKLIFIFLMSIQFLFAQKRSERTFAAEGIKEIEISSNEIFKITVTAQKTDKIALTSYIQGEHFEDLSVISSVENGILQLNTEYNPFYKAENDKLSAHKVISIELELIIPENLKISIRSQLSSVFATGNFKNFEVGLDNGNCELTNFLGNANLQTKNGFIKVVAKNDVSAKVKSEHGEIENTLPEIGKYLVVAESISGDISLSQEK